MSLKRSLLSSFTLLLACCHRGNQDHVELKVPIEVARPSQVQEFGRITVSGTLMPQGAPSMVAFQVPGRAIKVLFREGEAVRKGQVMAVLDAENLTHALEAARAQVAAAKASANQADQEFHRMKQLFDTRSLAANDFAKFTAGRDATKDQLDQAIAGEGIARKNLAEAQLVAPIGGFIAKRLLEPGVMVGAGQPVFEIDQMDPIEVNVGIPETDVRQVKVGLAATVTIPAWPGRSFQGTVRVVNIAADPTSRTYMARIRVPNPQRELKVGMVAEVSILGSQRMDMLMIPVEAIVRDPQGAPLVFQFFPDQQRVYSKRVEIGAYYGRDVQIRTGLTGQEAIVVAGQNTLRNGMAAELVQGRK